MSEPSEFPALVREAAAAGWPLRSIEGTVAEIHQLELEESAQIWWCRPTVSGLALGSTQRELVLDTDLASRWEVEVERRRSGGGAVLVEPGDLLWVDLLVPRGHRLWHDDIGKAAVVIGELWVAALDELGLSAEVHRGGLDSGVWGDLACMAGRGPGEVFIEGAKAVGISQRRTPRVARLQCAAVIQWRPERLAALLDPPLRPGQPTLGEALQNAATAIPADPIDLLRSFIRHL